MKIELTPVSRATARWRSEETEITIVADRAGDLPEIDSGWTVIFTSIDQFGQPVLLLLKGEPDYVVSAGPQGTIPRLRSRRLNQFQIVQMTPTALSKSTCRLPTRTITSFNLYQRDGGLQSVDDAKAYTTKRTCIRSIGDKGLFLPCRRWVNDVCVSSNDTIWISYFDEGIYGPTKLAQEGLVGMNPMARSCSATRMPDRRWDHPNRRLYRNQRGRRRVCVGLLLHRLSIGKLRDPKQVRAWGELPVEFAEAFAVENLKALFAGGYENRRLLHLLDLQRHRHWPAKVLDSDGNMLPFEASLGRGALLYLLNGRCLYTVDCRKLTLAQ